jgi:hypothetical protein
MAKNIILTVFINKFKFKETNVIIQICLPSAIPEACIQLPKAVKDYVTES